MSNRKTITIAGVTYATIKDAARSIGIKPESLYCRRSRKAHNIVAPVKPHQRPVLVDGKIVKDTATAAAMIGVCPQYLRLCICNGTKCGGHDVKRPTELDLCLSEIEQRNRQPYQFSR